MWSVRQTWKMGRRATSFLGALLVAVLLAAGPAGAAFETVNLSSLLGTPGRPLTKSVRPAIAVNKAGQVFVAWQDGGDIFFARSEPAVAMCGGSGAPEFKTLPVNLSVGTGGATALNPSAGASAAALAALDVGEVYVAWQAPSAPGKFTSIWFTRSTEDGQNFKPPVNLSGASAANSPSVAADTAGVFVAWSGGSGDIFLARSAVGANFGFGPGAPVNVPNTLFTSSRSPAVAVDANSVYLAWVEDASGRVSVPYRKFDRTTMTLMDSRLNLSIGLVGSPFDLSLAVRDGIVSAAFVSGAAVYHALSSVNFSPEIISGPGPVVASGSRVARRNGSALVSWAELLAGNVEIRYRVLGKAGTPDPPLTVSATAGVSLSPAVAVGFDDRLLVAWQETVNPKFEIYLGYSGGSGTVPMKADVWMKPPVLDLRHLARGRGDEHSSRGPGSGRVTLFIEVAGLNAAEMEMIDVSTLKLNGQPVVVMVPGERDEDGDDDVAKLGDRNHNGIPDLKVKLSRSAFAAGLADAQGTGSYTYTIEGQTKIGSTMSRCFAGTGTVQIRR